MRFRLCCAIAAMLPIAIESTAISISISCQSCERTISPLPSMRMTIANAASFGALPISSATGVGAP